MNLKIKKWTNKLLKLILIIFIFGMALYPKSTFSVDNTAQKGYLGAFLNAVNSVSNSEDNIVYSEEYLEWLQLPEEERAKSEVIPRKEFVSIDTIKTDNSNESSSSIKNLGRSTVQASTLPTSYFLGTSGIVSDNVAQYGGISINVENQGQAGWCWAFASLKSAQTNMEVTKGIDYDFSEAHLAYMRAPYADGWDNAVTDAGIAWDIGGGFADLKYYAGIYTKPGYNPTKKIKGPVLESTVPNPSSKSNKYEFNDDTKTMMQSANIAAKVTKTIDYPTITKTYDANNQVRTYNVIDEDLSLFRNTIKNHIINYGRSICSCMGSK